MTDRNRLWLILGIVGGALLLLQGIPTTAQPPSVTLPPTLPPTPGPPTGDVLNALKELDANGNGLIDESEIVEATQLWVSKLSLPSGLLVGDEVYARATASWAAQAPYGGL